MIDDYQQILSMYALSLPDKTKLMRPMSRKAKRLLVSMLDWSKQYHVKLWGSVADFMKDFYNEFEPLHYEEICHRFNIDHHLTKMKSGKAGIIPGSHKTKRQVLDSMRLDHFESMKWIQDSALQDNGKRIGSITNLQAIEVYEWITTNFLLTDFSEDDLNRIISLGDEKFSFATVKREALKIHDADKRSMAYLYAIVRDLTIKEEAMRAKNVDIVSSQEFKLKSIIEIASEASTKMVHKTDQDATKRWQHELSILESIKDIKY